MHPLNAALRFALEIAALVPGVLLAGHYLASYQRIIWLLQQK